MKTCIIIHCAIEVEDFDQYAIDEGIALLDTYGAKAMSVCKFKVRDVKSATYIGKGQVEQVLTAITDHNADFVFWNHNIKQRNQRELERALKKPIFDRTKIILDIFQARAVSSEEKLQVELAAKKYARTKIVKAWSHLERQRGSSSTVGGPGEQQLELDRRILDEKIKVYTKKLKKLRISREQQRKVRTGAPIISIVGYTNVGKTTLFNLLTKENKLAEDKLFATLTPKISKFAIDNRILIADTVGFIRNFPALLTNAFATTLEEIKYSCLILHVRDIRMPKEERYSEAVIDILHNLGAAQIPRISVWSKWDAVPSDTVQPEGVCISSHNGLGIDELKKQILDFALVANKIKN